MPEPLFSLITPCGVAANLGNLPRIQDSIRFEWVWVWVIVLGGIGPAETAPNEKIKVVTTSRDTSAGHRLRNLGLQHVPKRNSSNYVYFIDDDNIVHPSLWEYLPLYIRSHPHQVYTFAACRHGEHFPGRCEVNRIDTGQFVVERNISSSWHLDYNADGRYIAAKCAKHTHYTIDRQLAYYNFLKRRPKESQAKACLKKLSTLSQPAQDQAV